MLSASEDIGDALIAVYRLMKRLSTPSTIDEIIDEGRSHGYEISEGEFRIQIRRLIEVGAVQKWGDCYVLRDSGALLCRKIESLATPMKLT